MWDGAEHPREACLIDELNIEYIETRKKMLYYCAGFLNVERPVLCLSPSVSFLCLFASQLIMVIFVKKIHKGAKNGLILLYCVLVRFRTLAFLSFRTF